MRKKYIQPVVCPVEVEEEELICSTVGVNYTDLTGKGDDGNFYIHGVQVKESIYNFYDIYGRWPTDDEIDEYNLSKSTISWSGIETDSW